MQTFRNFDKSTLDMKHTGRFLTVLLALLMAASCGPGESRQQVDVTNVEVGEVTIGRYGKTIFSLDTAQLQEELKRIRPEFRIFLDGDLDDPETLERMKGFITDEQLIQANRDVQQHFGDLGWLEEELTDLFRHLEYYFPGSETPRVYSYVSGFDYEFRTQYYNDNLLIALDMYLGADYPAYQKLGVPQYVIRRFAPRYISRDCAMEIGKSKINFRNVGNDLLDLMINEGKLLWFAKAMIPGLDDKVLFDYTPEQASWARQNEGLVWSFMIENEVLYSSEPQYIQKFILESPFTSYFGQESPPRLGAYTGYRIVDRYMQRNGGISLEALMNEYNSAEILKGSRYKPEL